MTVWRCELMTSRHGHHVHSHSIDDVKARALLWCRVPREGGKLERESWEREESSLAKANFPSPQPWIDFLFRSHLDENLFICWRLSDVKQITDDKNVYLSYCGGIWLSLTHSLSLPLSRLSLSFSALSAEDFSHLRTHMLSQSISGVLSDKTRSAPALAFRLKVLRKETFVNKQLGSINSLAKLLFDNKFSYAVSW